MVILMAYRVVQQVSIVLVPVAAKYHARGDQNLLQQTLIRGCRYCLLIAAIALVPVLVQMGVFLRLWMGADFTWLAPYAIPLGLVAVVTASSSATAQILQGTGDAKRPFVAMVFALAGGVTTMVIGLLAGAGFGAVVAGLGVGQIARWMVLTVQGIAASRCSPMHLLWQAYLQPLIAISVCGLATWWLQRWIAPADWLGFFLVYGAGVAMLGLALPAIMTRQEWQLAREVLSKARRKLTGRAG
jgi:O-antigen/teichoic acid export membrane protein